MLTIAVPKGRILDEVSDLLLKSGLISEKIKEDRKLVMDFPDDGLRFILSKPSDVPVYVKYGAADIGIAGKDVLLETDQETMEILDLGIGRCRLSLCGRVQTQPDFGKMPRIASKYPKTAGRHFREKGQQVEIIKLNGSIEIAPVLGLTDFIVDIVSTGQTLKENGLAEIEIIQEISARLIVNQASFYLKGQEITGFIEKIRTYLGE